MPWVESRRRAARRAVPDPSRGTRRTRRTGRWGVPGAGLPLSPSSGWPPSEPVEAAARSSSRSSSRSSPPPHRVLLASVPPAPAVCDAESESEGWSPCSARLPPDGLRSDGWRTRSGRLRLTPTFALAIQPPRIDASASRRCCDTQDACRARYRQPRSATRHARLLPRPFALLRRSATGQSVFASQRMGTRSALCVSTDPHARQPNDSYTRVRA